MLYFILLVLGAWLLAMGTRANELYKLTADQKDSAPEEQVSAWYNLGGMNLLILECGSGTFASFVTGVGVIAAYIGLWLCALSNWNGLWLIVAGVLVCGMIQYAFLQRIKTMFRRYKRRTKQNPKEVFIRKTGPKHAVYMSILIGTGKATSFLLICSVVGILFYIFLKKTAQVIIYKEEMVERGIGSETIVDENGNEWTCQYYFGDDLRFFTNANGDHICVKADELHGAQKRADIIHVGKYTFYNKR